MGSWTNLREHCTVVQVSVMQIVGTQVIFDAVTI